MEFDSNEAQNEANTDGAVGYDSLKTYGTNGNSKPNNTKIDINDEPMVSTGNA